MQYGFIIDNRKCIGCHACTVACKSEHDVAVGVYRTWVKYIEKGTYPDVSRFFTVMRCNHCEDAPCVEICPVTALFVRDDGIVDFDNNRCIGCKSCMQACPYDALYIDPNTHTAAKCNYCAHRVDVGLEPACVNVCPEHAIISGDLDNPESEIAILMAREQVQVRKAEKGTRPKLFYINGDSSALNPSETDQGLEYMQTSQSAGVGHYARFADAKIAEADVVKMAEELARGQQVKTGKDSGVKPSARRIHDIPDKGVMWGWEVSAYLWTKAVSAGLILVYLLSSWLNQNEISVEEPIVIGSALVFLVLTGFFLVKDLDQPKRFLYVLLRPQWRSWLVRGAYSIFLFSGFLALWLLCLLENLQTMYMIAQGGAFVTGLVVAIYTAFLFAQAKGRDFWQSPMLPLHMIVHAVMAGAAGLILMVVGFNVLQDLAFLEVVLVVSIMVNIVTIAAELFTTHSTADAARAARMILKDRWFWIGSILAGNILPLGLLLASTDDFIPVIASLVLFGILITENIWVKVPQRIPLS